MPMTLKATYRSALCAAAGTALTTFNKDHENLQPKVIALRSMQHTSGDMLLNPPAYADFKAKVKINDKVSAAPVAADRALSIC